MVFGKQRSLQRVGRRFLGKRLLTWLLSALPAWAVRETWCPGAGTSPSLAVDAWQWCEAAGCPWGVRWGLSISYSPREHPELPAPTPRACGLLPGGFTPNRLPGGWGGFHQGRGIGGSLQLPGTPQRGA